MIKLKNVSRHFKMGDSLIKALDSINLEIKEGKFVAIMGPSGSGKSTIMNLIGGLDSPSKGDIFIGDYNLKNFKDKQISKYRNKKIGFIFQSFNLQPTYTALENVTLPLFFSKVKPKIRNEKAKQALTTVKLGNRLKHKPGELSGGERQRVCIARSLINDPDIILADEPTGNLDSKTGKVIIDLLKNLAHKNKITVIMVTHDSDMASFADRIIKIKDGKIV